MPGLSGQVNLLQDVKDLSANVTRLARRVTCRSRKIPRGATTCKPSVPARTGRGALPPANRETPTAGDDDAVGPDLDVRPYTNGPAEARSGPIVRRSMYAVVRIS